MSSSNITIATASTYSQAANAFDFFSTFIAPSICAFGMTTNILNIVVFSHKELKDETYMYLKMNAYSNFVYLFCCFFIFSARCGIYCNLGDSYAANLYYWIFYTYLKGIPAIFTVCIQIIVSLLRLNIVSNRKTCKLPDYKITSVFLVLFAAIYYSPNLITKQILATKVTLNSGAVATSNLTSSFYYTYSITNNSIGNSLVGKWLIILTTFIRGYVCAIIIIIINVISKMKLSTHFEKKSKMKHGGHRKVASINKFLLFFYNVKLHVLDFIWY